MMSIAVVNCGPVQKALCGCDARGRKRGSRLTTRVDGGASH